MVKFTTFVGLCITTVISIMYTSYLLITKGLSVETTGWCLFSLISIVFIMNLISIIKTVREYSYVLDIYRKSAESE